MERARTDADVDAECGGINQELCGRGGGCLKF